MNLLVGGASLYVINATPYLWRRTVYRKDYVDEWPFPDVIQPDSQVEVQVKWTGQFGGHGRTGDVVGYNIVGNDASFEFQCAYDGGLKFFLNLTAMSTLTDPEHNIVDIPPVFDSFTGPHHGLVTLMIGGVRGAFLSNLSRAPPTTRWMQLLMSMSPNRTLGSLCLPASHDSGMGVVGHGTAFGTESRCRTQTHDIYGQLKMGVRFFDIRPIISAGQYYAGHYTMAPWPLKGQGANGEPMRRIVEEVNHFTSSNNELVILYLNGGSQTDESSFRGLNQAEWEGLARELSKLDHLFKRPRDVPLTDLTLKELIGKGPAVVVLLQFGIREVNLDPYLGSGMYHPGNTFNFEHSYSNTVDPLELERDQIAKMSAWTANPQGKYGFWLDWCLTQDNWAAAIANPSVRQLSDWANPRLALAVMRHFNHDYYPRIISADYIQDSTLLAVTWALNTRKVTRNNHFYSINETPQSYTNEGITGYVYKAQVPNSIPLRRYWHPMLNDHFYTTNEQGENCETTGYHFEGNARYLPTSDANGATVLYRYRLDGQNEEHFYTTDPNAEGSKDYTREGSAGYIFPTQVENTVPFYRWFGGN